MSAIVESLITVLKDKYPTIQLSNVCSISKQIKEENPALDKIITVKLHCKGVCKSSAENLLLGATAYYKRKKGQLIYGKQNFHHGAIGVVPDDLDGGITSKDIPSFDIDSSKCDVLFIMYQMQRPQYYRSVEALTTGTGSKRLKENVFLKLPIILPDINIQKQIVCIIKSMIEKQKIEESILEDLQNQKKYLLQQMFI